MIINDVCLFRSGMLSDRSNTHVNVLSSLRVEEKATSNVDPAGNQEPVLTTISFGQVWRSVEGHEFLHNSSKVQERQRIVGRNIVCSHF